MELNTSRVLPSGHFYANLSDMLYKQLLAAIGKEVTPVDFANYMVFHNRKLFKPEYEPRPFSYAIRLPDHYPEGTVGIDVQHPDGSITEPIQTIVRWFAFHFFPLTLQGGARP